MSLYQSKGASQIPHGPFGGCKEDQKDAGFLVLWLLWLQVVSRGVDGVERAICIMPQDHFITPEQTREKINKQSYARDGYRMMPSFRQAFFSAVAERPTA